MQNRARMEAGAHEPAKECQLSMPTLAEVVGIHASQNFTLYGKRPLRRSLKDVLSFVRYRKGLPYKV